MEGDSNDLVTFFTSKSKNENTTKATTQWTNNFKKWLCTKGITENFETLEPKELNEHLKLYFSSVKKKDGQDYEPASLNVMQKSIERYLKDNEYPVSILRDTAFKQSRDVLEGRARYLRERGMGRRPNKADSLTAEEEKCLWDSEQLGTSTPQSLINTLWWLLTQHFGLRGRQEHHSMMVEDFLFKLDDEGNKYITFSEKMTKTRQAGLVDKQRPVIPKMFETNTERCPVAIFEYYLSKRPETYRNSGPFYLAVIPNPTSDVWYKVSRMGKNTIDSIMKTMAQKSSLSGGTKRFTNHSARKTLVKKLKKARVEKADIIGITGHTKETGLDPYDSGDECQQREISNLIDTGEQQPHCSKTVSKLPATADSLSKKQGNFQFLSQETWMEIFGEPRSSTNSAPVNVMHFHGNFYGDVSFGGSSLSNTKCATKTRRIIYSSEEEC